MGGDKKNEPKPPRGAEREAIKNPLVEQARAVGAQDYNKRFDAVIGQQPACQLNNINLSFFSKKVLTLLFSACNFPT